MFFGEHQKILDPPQEDHSVIRIFLDKDGSFYPEFYIPDSRIESSDKSLKGWSKKQKTGFAKVLDQYQISDTSNAFVKLQTKIVEQLSDSINEAAESKTDVIFLIHGFRKPFKDTPGGRTSVYENGIYRESILNSPACMKVNPLFVEVYWDSTFDCCFSANAKENKVLFELFEKQARPNAANVGYSLRQILNEIDNKQIVMLSHSLGARVITASLFNAYESEVSEYNKSIDTPSKAKIKAGFVAAAIEANDFNSAYDRDGRSFEYDNYSFFINYNKKDFVLKKKDPLISLFGPGASKYGPTTLGCNKGGDISKVTKLLSQKNTLVKTVNASDVGKCHLVSCYCKSDSFDELLSLMFMEK